MVRVLILSDSHGLTKEITDIKKRHDADYMIHCGDSELEADAPELEGFTAVAGNCDLDSRFPLQRKLKIGQFAFLIVHGHMHQVKRNLMTLCYSAQEADASVVCFGHTHIAGAEKIHNSLYINPGSIRMPNSRSEKTYAILEWDEPENAAVIFYTKNGEKVEDLTIRTSLTG